MPTLRTELGGNRQRFARLAATVMLCSSFGNPSASSLLAQQQHTSDANRPLLITRARQVHDLPGELASKARVEISGVVTYYDPGQPNLFIQDKSGGVYIDTTKTYPLQYGDYVSVRGIAAGSYRTQVETNPEIKVLA